MTFFLQTPKVLNVFQFPREFNIYIAYANVLQILLWSVDVYLTHIDFLTYRARNRFDSSEFAKMSQCTFFALAFVRFAIVKVVRSVRARKLLSKSCTSRAIIAGWTQSPWVRFSAGAIAPFGTSGALFRSVEIRAV